MGIIPERTAEEQKAYDLSLDRAFGETPMHLAFINADQKAADAAAEQAARDQALNESFGEGPIATRLAGQRFDR